MTIIKLLVNHSKRLAFITILFSILAGISVTSIIAIINNIVIHSPQNTDNLTWLFIISLIGFIISGIASEYLLTKFSNTILYSLRIEISNRILNSELTHIEKSRPHKLLAIVTEDILVLTNTIAELPTLIINLPIIIGCFIYIGFLSLTLLIGIAIFILLVYLIYKKPLSIAQQKLQSCRNITDTIYSYFKDMIFGIKELLQNRQKKHYFFTTKVKQETKKFKEENIKYRFIYRSVVKIVDILIFIGIGVLLFIIAPQLNIAKDTLNSFILILVFMVGPMGHCLNFINRYNQAEIAIKNIESLRKRYLINHKENYSTSSFHTISKISFKNITFRYPETHFELGPINHVFESNKIHFIIGGNGSGKSTLLNILTGLYKPTFGSIHLDNNIINQHNIENYRSCFGVIFSDNYLFDQLYDNINKEKKEKINRYLSKFKLDKIISFNNNNFSTIQVSQGQKKRLALIMELCLDKPVYVFDEWAADQDPEFKAYFYKTILQDLKNDGKTVIAITHDDHYFHCCDSIIKMNNGKLSSIKTNTIVHESITIT